MKEKTIEKIPYLTLQKVNRKHDVKYVAVTELKTVGNEQHLFVEVYRNSKTTKEIPVVRIVLTKKDYGNYFPEKGEWTRQKITTDIYYSTQGLIWYANGERSGSWQEAAEKNVLMCKEDLDRIKKICNEKIWNQEKWWEYIYRHEDCIDSAKRRAAEHRRYERRKKALDDRIANTQELPEKKIVERADMLYFSREHFLYYKKTGCWAKITCSKCGCITEGRWKDGISYESQFQKSISEPREGTYGKCPQCGEYGMYKCQGKQKKERSKKVHIFLGQKYKETGMVMRYVEVEKQWNLEWICGEKGPEMYGANEKITCTEIARAYFLPEKETQVDYNKYNPYTGETFWDDCNLYGNANISIKEATVMKETYDEMKGTMFQYCALDKYEEQKRNVNAIDYLDRYKHTPQLEMLVKMGLTGVVDTLMRYQYGIVNCESAKRLDLFLGIRKEHIKQLIESKGDRKLLDVMKVEYHMGAQWTDKQVEQLAETGLDERYIKTITRYMSLQQLLNRISKYAGCEYGSGCSSTIDRIEMTASRYADYLNMRVELGYDLNNTVYQYPKNLNNAHEKMVMESNKREMDKRLEDVKNRFPNIRKNYRKLRNQFLYEDEKYILRPARSAEEIVMEGRILHHCVGGDNYLSKHDRGETYILMLREKEDTETPYITIEISAKDYRIIQWYGANDKQPDKENVQRWLDKYIDMLKNGTLKENTEKTLQKAS